MARVFSSSLLRSHRFLVLSCLVVVLCLSLLGGCLGRKQALQEEAHPQGTFTIPFGAKVEGGGQEIPVQGAFVARADGGQVTFLLPFGQALGQCRYGHSKKKSGLFMDCVPAHRSVPKALLTRMALAVYRIACLVTPEGIGFSRRGPGFQVTCNDKSCVYTEGQGRQDDTELKSTPHPSVLKDASQAKPSLLADTSAQKNTGNKIGNKAENKGGEQLALAPVAPELTNAAAPFRLRFHFTTVERP